MRNRLFGYRDAGPVFIWAFVAIQAAGFIGGMFANAIPAVASYLFLSSFLTNTALAAAYFLYTKAVSVSPIRASRLDGRFAWWILPLACALTYLLQYASIGSMTLFDGWLRSSGYESQNMLMGITFLEYGAGGLIGNLLLVGLVTGFCEELIFRGALLQSLRGRFRDGTAILLSAAAFMIFHGSPDQTIFQFFFGLLLGFVTVRTDSIVPAMVMHAFNNMLSIATTAGGVSGEVFPLPANTGALIAVAILGLIAAVILLPLIIDAATGKIKQNYVVRLLARVVTKDRAAVGEIPPMRQERDGTEEQEEEPAILDPVPNRHADNLSTVLFVIGCVVCLALWIVNLVLGF